MPLPLSSSYFTLEPSGISITARNSCGTFLPGLKSCHGCIAMSPGLRSDCKSHRVIRQHNLAALARTYINGLRIDVLKRCVLQITLGEKKYTTFAAPQASKRFLVFKNARSVRKI